MTYEQLRLDNQLCFRLYTAARLVIQKYRPYLDPLDLTYPQYLVLLLLWEEDGRLVGDIARRLQLETNTVTPLIQRMERQGLVVRRRGQTDTRQRIVLLTERGRALQEQAKHIPQCLANQMVEQGVSIDQMACLIPPLDVLIAALSH